MFDRWNDNGEDERKRRRVGGHKESEERMSAVRAPIEKTMELMQPHFETLGRAKEWEMRPDVDKRKDWEPSNVVKVSLNGDESQSYYVRITDCKRFPSFEKAIAGIGWEKLLSGLDPSEVHDDATAVEYYNKIANGEYRQKAVDHGVVAWKMERINM
jgi:hypothetical protein